MSKVETLTSDGKAYLDVGQYHKALDCFEKALQLKPDDPELWNFKGIVLRSAGLYEEAVECFNRSLEIDPRDRHSS